MLLTEQQGGLTGQVSGCRNTHLNPISHSSLPACGCLLPLARLLWFLITGRFPSLARFKPFDFRFLLLRQACGGAREGEDKSKFGVPGPKGSGDRAIGARMELSGACVDPRGREGQAGALPLPDAFCAVPPGGWVLQGVGRGSGGASGMAGGGSCKTLRDSCAQSGQACCARCVLQKGLTGALGRFEPVELARLLRRMRYIGRMLVLDPASVEHSARRADPASWLLRTCVCRSRTVPRW